jgi:hypothetical protein
VIERIWRASAPAAGTLADVYLQVRGITLRSLPADLRFVGRLWHTPTSTAWPAMVAVVRDVSGHMIGLHRTFLHSDGSGKAPVEPSKMTLGATGGGAVRLAPAGPALAVSEGIETGLSVMAATGMPTWTGLSAGGIRTLVLPRLPLARTVTIAADSDPVGIEAAYGAAYRWQAEGRLVRIALPPLGMDFNDLARERDHA